jgi:hypothetical protein
LVGAAVATLLFFTVLLSHASAVPLDLIAVYPSPGRLHWLAPRFLASGSEWWR